MKKDLEVYSNFLKIAQKNRELFLEPTDYGDNRNYAYKGVRIKLITEGKNWYAIVEGDQMDSSISKKSALYYACKHIQECIDKKSK